MRWLLSSALVLPACFSPELEDGVIACGEAGCPEGLHCADDGRCYRDPDEAFARRGALVVANDGAQVGVYAYCDDSLRAWWRGPSGPHVAAAWGDRDGDDQPDLAVASGREITLWEVRPEGMTEIGVTEAAGEIRDLAWGELDDDQDDELVVAGTGPVEVMHWHQDAYALVVRARTGAPVDALAVAAMPRKGNRGDELAVGTVGQSVLLLEQEGGGLVEEWRAERVEDAVDVAVGDEGDDEPVIAVATAGGPVRIYERREHWFELLWTAAEGVGVDAVAWSDDGAPAELAIATADGALHVYRGDPAAMTPVSTIADEGATTALAWGDIDGDGDDDLAVGHAGAPTRVYRNDDGELSAAWSLPAAPTVDLAWTTWRGAPDPCR